MRVNQQLKLADQIEGYVHVLTYVCISKHIHTHTCGIKICSAIAFGLEIPGK